MTTRAVCVATLRQAPFLHIAIVAGVAMLMVSEVLRTGTGFVRAVDAQRRPTQLGGQQAQKENRKPPTHRTDFISKIFSSGTVVPRTSMPTRGLLHPAGRKASVGFGGRRDHPADARINAIPGLR